MPIYKIQCKSCDIQREELMKWSERDSFLEDHCCAQCDGKLSFGLTMVSKTPGRWGDTGFGGGVNGYYDSGLGITYHNSMERDAIIKKRGLVSESDLPKHFFEDRLEKQNAADRALDKKNDEYQRLVKKHGGDEAAKRKAINTVLNDDLMYKEMKETTPKRLKEKK